MGSSNPFKDQNYSFKKKLLPWALTALLPMAFICLYFYNFSSSDQLSSTISNHIVNLISPTPSCSSDSVDYSSKEERSNNANDYNNLTIQTKCDYSNGKWVQDKMAPLYNGTTCSFIKEGRNCMLYGRPDSDYLYWKWMPRECEIPRFDARKFLDLVKNKNLAFVGDSLARNQLESLLCMLATFSSPNLFYSYGEDNKFRRWNFPSHNVNVSVYWSPFLVHGIEKTEAKNYNTLYLDSVDETWTVELDQIDMLVLSVGHWFLHPAVYHFEGSVLGCHYCTGQNYSEIGFYDVYSKALNTAIGTAIHRKAEHNEGIYVVLTTFSPAHFEGEWDKLGACPKTKPYGEEGKKLEGMDEEMREIGVEQVKAANLKAKGLGNIRVEALDVTKLAFLRPDGHPGPYMHPFPFANGISERVQNDCVHWCMPGPIDTWNEILLDMMRKRDE